MIKVKLGVARESVDNKPIRRRQSNTKPVEFGRLNGNLRKLTLTGKTRDGLQVIKISIPSSKDIGL